MQRGLIWGLFGLVAVSVGVELVTGKSRMRGSVLVLRAERPEAYWASIGVKILIAAGILVFGLGSPG